MVGGMPEKDANEFMEVEEKKIDFYGGIPKDKQKLVLNIFKFSVLLIVILIIYMISLIIYK
ncbi:hypothetical protein COS74_00490 [bacterium CG06_land_8_20_14_3_00_33_50]|nr:MAG: hypothetical protein COS74_00490 [bacterium CG06_land_8_20_14_3_00_33_50]